MADQTTYLRVNAYRTLDRSAFISQGEILALLLRSFGLADSNGSFSINDTTGFWRYSPSVDAIADALKAATPMGRQQAETIVRQRLGELNQAIRRLTKLPDLFDGSLAISHVTPTGTNATAEGSNRWQFHYATEVPSFEVVEVDLTGNRRVVRREQCIVQGEAVVVELVGNVIGSIQYSKLPSTGASSEVVDDTASVQYIAEKNGLVQYLSVARISRILPFLQSPEAGLIPLTREGRATMHSALNSAPMLAAKDSITMPLIVAAPKGSMAMSEFIDLVRAEEAKYPEAERSDTKLMVTRLRKIFYNPDGWDDFLIPGAAAIAPPYSEYRERERERKRVEPFGPLNNFDLVDRETYPVDSSGRMPSIYTHQEVRIEVGPTAGAFVDMGHVFAGWDAFNHPGPVVAPGLYDIKINRNWDATTWIGDLGSVLAEAWVAYVNGEQPLSYATLQRLVDKYAPAQDMLGNIDSYVLSTQGFSGKVSDILDQYYYEKNPGNGQQQRFRVFAQEIGIGPFENGQFRNAGTRAEMHLDEINDAAALYLAAGADPPDWTRIKTYTGVWAMSAEDNVVRHLYIALVDSLRKVF
jgi:hypothetical protein